MQITVSHVGRGRYRARLTSDGMNRTLCTSRTPFLRAARELKAEGLANDDTVLTMVHEGSDVVAIRGRVGDAAALTVREANGAPRFAPYRPFTEESGGDDEDA